MKKVEKCDIYSDKRALHALQSILERKNTAEVYIGRYGLVVREIKRKLIYDQSEHS